MGRSTRRSQFRSGSTETRLGVCDCISQLTMQVQLLSSDGETFDVPRDVAKQSVTIENTIEGAGVRTGSY